MDMFSNLGKTLALLRNLRGLTQAGVARAAGVGKSQLSKYEGGRELPKFDSLEKVLRVLRVDPLQFFFAMRAVDQCGALLGGGLKVEDSLEFVQAVRPLSEPLDQAFDTILKGLLGLHRVAFEEALRWRLEMRLAGGESGRDAGCT